MAQYYGNAVVTFPSQVWLNTTEMLYSHFPYTLWHNTTKML